jgi:hypothetical protein
LIAENCQRGRDYGGVGKGLRDDGIKGLRDYGVAGRGIKGFRGEGIKEEKNK